MYVCTIQNEFSWSYNIKMISLQLRTGNKSTIDIYVYLLFIFIVEYCVHTSEQ